MTARQGVFPPDGTADGTFHWIGAPGSSKHLWKWKSGKWIEGSLRHRPEISWLAGFTYLGPAPTYEKSQADAADGERFRWLVKNQSDGMQIMWRSKFTGPGIDIRAAIDAAMKEAKP